MLSAEQRAELAWWYDRAKDRSQSYQGGLDVETMIAVKEHLAAVEQLLSEVEWTAPDEYAGTNCPICDAWESKGHAPDCRLAAALKEE